MVITNGDFETGDFTGWDVGYSGSGYLSEVIAGAKRSGSYGARLQASDDTDASVWRYQNIGTVTAGQHIKIWYKINTSIDGSGETMIRVLQITLIGDAHNHEILYSENDPTGDYTLIDYTVTESDTNAVLTFLVGVYT